MHVLCCGVQSVECGSPNLVTIWSIQGREPSLVDCTQPSLSLPGQINEISGNDGQARKYPTPNQDQ